VSITIILPFDAADNPKPAASADRSCQSSARDKAHRCQYDWMLNTEALRKASRNRHVSHPMFRIPRGSTVAKSAAMSTVVNAIGGSLDADAEYPSAMSTSVKSRPP